MPSAVLPVKHCPQYPHLQKKVPAIPCRAPFLLVPKKGTVAPWYFNRFPKGSDRGPRSHYRSQKWHDRGPRDLYRFQNGTTGGTLDFKNGRIVILFRRGGCISFSPSFLAVQVPCVLECELRCTSYFPRSKAAESRHDQE